MHIDEILRPHRRCRFMTLLVNFVSMSVHLRSAKEGPSTMRRTCICRGTSSNPCSSLVSHAPALRMQKMNMQLHEQQRRGPVSFQHSSACPYRFSQQSHLSCTSPIYRPGERSEGPLADNDCNKQDRE